MIYDLSEQEVTALLQIMDAGVRSTGLQHAANAAFLAEKLRAPFVAAAKAAAESAAVPDAEAA